jgi:hypothetical protein
MLVGVVKRGKYGERLIDTIKKHTDFQVVSAEVPQYLPGFIEDPEEFVRNLNLNPELFKADLLILYTFHPDITPEIVRGREAWRKGRHNSGRHRPGRLHWRAGEHRREVQHPH